MAITETLLTALIFVPMSPDVESTSKFSSFIVASPTIKQSTFVPSAKMETSFISMEKRSLFEKTEGELLSYYDLEEDWDGYQGVTPQEDHIRFAIDYLDFIRLQGLRSPKPMLSGDGEVSLYWNSDVVHIEISFEDDKLISYLVSSADKVVGEDDVTVCDADSYLIPPSIQSELIRTSKFETSLVA